MTEEVCVKSLRHAVGWDELVRDCPYVGTGICDSYRNDHNGPCNVKEKHIQRPVKGFFSLTGFPLELALAMASGYVEGGEI